MIYYINKLLGVLTTIEGVTMAKASLTLPNGTVVQIEGTTQEVKELLELYSGNSGHQISGTKRVAQKKSIRKEGVSKSATPSQQVDITEIVNLVKSCDEAEDIEMNILDKSSQVDRVLLPLYIVHEYLNNTYTLSSGDITAVTTQLSVPVAQPNASRTLSGTAAKYLIGDSARKKGSAVRYKLNRRGVKYMKSVITGDSDGK